MCAQNQLIFMFYTQNWCDVEAGQLIYCFYTQISTQTGRFPEVAAGTGTC